jgi:hypothetical protein
VNDTSEEPYLALLSGMTVTSISMSGLSSLSSSGLGSPPYLTGNAPGALYGVDNAGMPIGRGFAFGQNNFQPTTAFTNSILFDKQSYHANDYQDAGKYDVQRGILQSSVSISSHSSFFVPLGIAVLSVPVASGGGSIPDGNHTYCVQPVGFNGGWGKSSCQSVTISGTNQTLSFSWTAVTGAKGYTISQDGNNCLPTSNANCSGLTTVAGTTTLTYRGRGANTLNVGAMTASGDGSNGFNASGHFGLQYACPETTAPTGVEGFDLIYCDSTARGYMEISGAGSPYLLTRTIARGTSVLGTSSISPGACATVVTGAAKGAAATDNLIVDDNASDLSAVTGYGVSTKGTLTIYKRVTDGEVNFTVCNSTGGSITPGALTLQWRVVR